MADSSRNKKLGLSLVPVEEEPRIIKKGKDAPILIITGMCGSGKTTTAQFLAWRFIVEWISRYATRPARPGEKSGQEYLFLIRKMFWKLYYQDKMMATVGQSDNPDGTTYYRGTPALADWPTGQLNTELILGILSPRLLLEILAHPDAPKNIKVVFLDGSDEILLPRIVDRRGGDWVTGHIKKNAEYRRLNLPHKYEVLGHRVINTDCTPPWSIGDEIVDFLELPHRR